MVTDGMRQGGPNHFNYLNIQVAVEKNSTELVQNMIEFGLTDSKYYSYVYDILQAVMPMLKHGFSEIVNNGEEY
jgi:hypothetical protein